MSSPLSDLHHHHNHNHHSQSGHLFGGGHHNQVGFEFVEARKDGSTWTKETHNVKLRQWTKASTRMASQVRDAADNIWRNSDISLRVRIPLALFDISPSLYVSVFRHWAPNIARECAQQRVLVQLARTGVVMKHDSLAACLITQQITCAIDVLSACMLVHIPLVPASFKLPSSRMVLDEWRGQARNASVFFAVRTENAYLSMLPNAEDSMVVEQYPKRGKRNYDEHDLGENEPESSSASSFASPETARRTTHTSSGTIIDLPIQFDAASPSASASASSATPSATSVHAGSAVLGTSTNTTSGHKTAKTSAFRPTGQAPLPSSPTAATPSRARPASSSSNEVTPTKELSMLSPGQLSPTRKGSASGGAAAAGAMHGTASTARQSHMYIHSFPYLPTHHHHHHHHHSAGGHQEMMAFGVRGRDFDYSIDTLFPTGHHD